MHGTKTGLFTDSGNGDVQSKATVPGDSDTARLRWSGSRGFGHGACAEQNDEGRYARKRAYCLKIRPLRDAYPKSDLFNKAVLFIKSFKTLELFSLNNKSSNLPHVYNTLSCSRLKCFD